ncbi:MAG: hypothetical protein ACLS8Y_09760 [Lachnospira sp.]|jgi:hypothetical protein|uniref:hypothetical protein n=1 Tax=Lachnospira sp. TaxID=2049031 RepID=UPI003A2AA7DD
MSEITYDSLKNNGVFTNIPILTLDERWYHLVNDKIKTDEIAYWEKRVNELLKKQGRLNTDIKDIKKLKKQLINDVVENMESDGDNREHVMNQNQRLIQESKDKIANLEDELMELPRELARANERLLTETLKVCYSKMNSNHEDIEVLNKWIDATRVKLKKNILIKQDKETNNENMYSLIHDIIGPENCSAVDRINEGTQETE